MSKIEIQGINVEVTESLKSHIEKNFTKLFESYEHFIVGDLEVKIEVDKHHEHLNMVSVRVPIVDNDIVMDKGGDDMYKVIVELQQATARKLRKTKEKIQGRRKNGNKRSPIEE